MMSLNENFNSFFDPFILRSEIDFEKLIAELWDKSMSWNI